MAFIRRFARLGLCLAIVLIAGSMAAAQADKPEPKTSSDFIQRAMDRFDAGDAKGAEADLTQAIKLDEKNAKAYRYRADLLLTLKRYEDALADATRSLELDASDDEAFSLRSSIYVKTKAYEKAMADLSSAIQLKPKVAEYYFSLGVLEMEHGKLSDALFDLNKALQLDDKVDLFYEARADLWMKHQNAAAAVLDYTRVIELEPNNLAPVLSRALARMVSGDFSGAKADFNEIIESNVNQEATAAALLGRAGIERMAGNYAQAIADFSRVLELVPGDLGTLSGRGESYAAQGNAIAAIKDLDVVLSKNPQLVNPRFNRGVAHASAGNRQAAVEDLDLAVEANPELLQRAAEVLTQPAVEVRKHVFLVKPRIEPSKPAEFLARAAERLKERPGSLDAWMDLLCALQLDPHFADAHLALGNYWLQFNATTAETHFTAAIAENPQLAAAYRQRASLRLNAGRNEEAAADATQFIKLGEPLGKDYSIRALAYLRLQKYPEAIADFTKAIELDDGRYNYPILIVHYKNRGLTYKLSGKLNEALVDYSKAIDLSDTSNETQLIRADLLRELGKLDEALKETEAVIKYTATAGGATNSAAHACRGKILMAKNQAAEALIALNAAISGDPNNADALLHRGIVQLKLGLAAQAQKDFDQAIELQPSLKAQVDQAQRAAKSPFGKLSPLKANP